MNLGNQQYPATRKINPVTSDETSEEFHPHSKALEGKELTLSQP